MNSRLRKSIRHDIRCLCSSPVSVSDFMRDVGALLSRAVPCDRWYMHAVEPSTLFASFGQQSASRCVPDYWWEVAKREFLDPDINTFSQLAGSADHAGALQLATGGVPRASTRFGNFVRREGACDELRATFVDNGLCWGIATFLRGGRVVFSSSEVRFVADLSRHVGDALRRIAWLNALPAARRFDPCLVVLDGNDRIEEATAGAAAWLDELKIYGALERELPLVVTIIAHRSRSSRGRPPSTSELRRIRTVGGNLVSVRGVSLGTQGSVSGRVAVLIQPTSADDVAEFLLAVHRLTARECEIARLLAGGRDSKDVAHVLRMSTHTVRGHIDTLLAKVGVHTRGELVAKLFVPGTGH